MLQRAEGTGQLPSEPGASGLSDLMSPSVPLRARAASGGAGQELTVPQMFRHYFQWRRLSTTSAAELCCCNCSRFLTTESWSSWSVRPRAPIWEGCLVVFTLTVVRWGGVWCGAVRWGVIPSRTLRQAPRRPQWRWYPEAVATTVRLCTLWEGPCD